MGTSLDLIDRLVMKQRKNVGAPSHAASGLRRADLGPRSPHAFECIGDPSRTACNSGDRPDDQQQKSISALDASVRQVDRLVREFSDYSAPVTMEKKPTDVSAVLATSLEAAAAQCAAKNISKKRSGTGSMACPRRRHASTPVFRQPVAQRHGSATRWRRDSRYRQQEHQGIGSAVRGLRSRRSAGHRTELFEFGKTTKVGGSGIGLPLSQLIVESHGGSLVYEDQNGATGASFRLTLSLEGN